MRPNTAWPPAGDHMSDVANDTEVQVYPTLDKTSTRPMRGYQALADVILFEG